MTLDTWQIVAGIVVAFMIGLSKTGLPSSTIFGVVVMALVFTPKSSVGLLLPILFTGDIFAVSYYRHKVIWKILLKIFPWVAVGLAGGYFVLEWSNNHSLQILIGVLVLVLVVLHVLISRVNKQLEDKINGSAWFSAGVGILAGFTTMVGNAAGAITTVYLLSQKLEKKELIGTGAWFYFSVNLIKLPLFASLGIITWHTLTFDLWLVPIVVIGGVVGIQVMKRISQVWFQRIMLIISCLGGIRLLLG